MRGPLLILTALVLALAWAGAAQAADERPNVVLVLVDDLSWDLVATMPEVRRMQDEGLTLERFFVTDSLCCPSRASILTGRFPHNTGVLRNVGRDGGYDAFDPAQGIAPTLAAAGYRAGFAGKYLNGYPADAGAPDAGWTDFLGGGSGYRGFGYRWNDNGTVVAPDAYATDANSARGQAFIHAAAQAGQPFFLELAPFAAHHPYVAAPRHADRFRDLDLPRDGAYGKAVQDPPAWLGERPALTRADRRELRSVHRRRARSLAAVDELLRDVRGTLLTAGVADRTYVVLTSDNGYHLGQHRLTTGKGTAFDHDIRVPFVAVGPGVPAGAASDVLAGTVDLASTVARLAGAPSTERDGRSLAGVLRGREPARWRTALLVEHHGLTGTERDPDDQAYRAGRPGVYRALRTRTRTYVEYATGERELYDLRSDPFQLDNLAGGLTRAERRAWHRALARYGRCAGAASCWRAGRLAPG